MDGRRRRLGIALARLHQGAFVPDASPVVVAPDLEADVVKLALRASAGALACRRLACAPRWPVLRDALRLHTLQAIDQARRVEALCRCLAAAGIDALFFKGWSLARRYPSAGLRPHGDADVLVRPEERARTEALLARAGLVYAVDLHHRLTSLPAATFDDLFRRRTTVPLRDVEVPCLGEGDHLAYLALHFLRHGGVRPMWLVDVALLIEARDPDAPWWSAVADDVDRCRMVKSVGALASLLVGTRASSTVPPTWMTDAVLDAWGRGVHPRTRALVFDTTSNLVRDLEERWPGALETVHDALPASLDVAPHLGHRLVVVWQKTADFVRRRRMAHRSTPVATPIPMVSPT